MSDAPGLGLCAPGKPQRNPGVLPPVSAGLVWAVPGQGHVVTVPLKVTKPLPASSRSGLAGLGRSPAQHLEVTGYVVVLAAHQGVLANGEPEFGGGACRAADRRRLRVP
jgi:hypothetical protein